MYILGFDILFCCWFCFNVAFLLCCCCCLVQLDKVIGKIVILTLTSFLLCCFVVLMLFPSWCWFVVDVGVRETTLGTLGWDKSFHVRTALKYVKVIYIGKFLTATPLFRCWRGVCLVVIVGSREHRDHQQTENSSQGKKTFKIVFDKKNNDTAKLL